MSNRESHPQYSGSDGTERSGERAIISVSNLRKTYGDGPNAVTALSGVDLEIDRGTVVGILGPNGAGKTTLIKSILNLVAPTAGEVQIHGADPRVRPRDVYQHVGAMFEGARNLYWRLTVRQNFRFFTRLRGANPAERSHQFEILLEQLGLEGKADTKVRKLSRGEKQKAALITVLTGRKDLVFLDEPTLGLDIESSLEMRRRLRDLVDEQDLTVALTSHDMDVIEDICDRVIIISRGEVIVDDSVDALLEAFRTDVYKLAVSDTVPDDVRRVIETSYDVVSWSDSLTEAEFRVALADVNRIHELTGMLIDAGVQIESIGTTDQDIEDVFVSVVDSEESGKASYDEVPRPRTQSGG